MFEIINLFGQDVKIKNYCCSSNPNEVQQLPMTLNLYIKITDLCNAKCSVCSNKENKQAAIIDLDKLSCVLEYLNSMNILNRITITGGEPFLNLTVFNNILNDIFRIIPDAVVTVNTNGFNISNLTKVESLSKIYEIHLSRHHYDNSKNEEFFGTKVPSFEQIENLLSKLDNKRKLVLNCLLMKSYISSIEDVSRYLEMASLLPIQRVGFLGLMPLNEDSIKEFININDIFGQMDDRFLENQHLYDKCFCECINGLYLAKNGGIIQYYASMKEKENCKYTKQLVYTSNNKLTVGFGGQSLI
jgi:molybdenum cofactor biosynthesis enzyme MoaA